MREGLLSTALMEGYAALVPIRAAKHGMGPAILTMVGTGDDFCEQLRMDMEDVGITNPKKTAELHKQQRARGMQPHNAVLWPVGMLLERGPQILPPEEMELVRKRLLDPSWQIILAVGGGGATALCLPVAVVNHCGDLSANPGQDLLEAAELGDAE
jgi:hypothetical protein